MDSKHSHHLRGGGGGGVLLLLGRRRRRLFGLCMCPLFRRRCLRYYYWAFSRLLLFPQRIARLSVIIIRALNICNINQDVHSSCLIFLHFFFFFSRTLFLANNIIIYGD